MENLRLESELPIKMASLDIWGSSTPGISSVHEMDEDDSTESTNNAPTRRSSRRKPQSPGVTNRRTILKPRKKQIKISMTEDEIRNYYCNQKIKTVSQTLETIFEEPKSTEGDTAILIGSRKLKRALTFHVGPHSKDKIKKRRSKIKRLLGNKSFLNRKKLSMQAFMKNLQTLDPDESLNINIISAVEESNDKSFETEE